MKNIILGTDWWTDCDDAVALRLLLEGEKQGLIRLLGISIDACMPYSVASVDAFLSFYGRDIPIGIDRNATRFLGRPRYQKHLAERSTKTNADGEDAVRLYRRLLTTSEEKADILEIGFLQVLNGLLSSPPDDISPLSGKELIERKVDKLWVMGGKWDRNGAKEHNFSNTRLACRSAHDICEKWHTIITFLGFEVGESVISGRNLPKEDILFQVMKDNGFPCGRSSWDPLLCLMAMLQSEEKAGYRITAGRAKVCPVTGRNYFIAGAGNHRFVSKIYEDEYYQNKIDGILSGESILSDFLP